MFDQLRFGSTGAACRFDHRTALHWRDGRWDADHDARSVEAVDTHPLKQKADHALGRIEVGDGTLSKRPDRHDVLRRSANHFPGLVTHCQDFTVVLVERDHRRLVKNDAPALGIDERIRRPKIDCQVACQG